MTREPRYWQSYGWCPDADAMYRQIACKYSCADYAYTCAGYPHTRAGCWYVCAACA